MTKEDIKNIIRENFEILKFPLHSGEPIDSTQPKQLPIRTEFLN